MLVPAKMDLSIKTKLVNPAGNPDTATVPKLLAISYSYPPKEEPRAIQVSRLLKYLNASTVLICEGKDGASSDAESFLEKTLRVPFSQSFGRDLLNRLSSRIYLPVVSKTPDHLGTWKRSVLNTVNSLVSRQGYRPDVLVTFAFPLIDSVIGLELKRRYNLPWLAHFSDPWVDSPFRHDDPLTKTLNRRLEQSERVDDVRPFEGELQRNRATTRMSGDVRAVDAEVVQQRRGVRRVVRDAHRGRGVCAPAPTAPVVSDQAELIDQRLHRHEWHERSRHDGTDQQYRFA